MDISLECAKTDISLGCDSELDNISVHKMNGEEIMRDKLNRDEVERLIPLIVYLSLICACGALGNSLVCYIYKTKYGPSNCRTFVICLSAIDLFSCVLVIPFEIFVILRQYNFQEEFVCKISVFLNTWPTLSSGLMLLSIAVDRYRKVCKPFGWQISLKLSRDISAFNIFVALGFSWLSPIIYGVNKKIFSAYNITISECTVKDSMTETVYPLINNITFAFLFLGALVSMSIMYCFIGIGVKRHSKKHLYQIRKQERRENSTLVDASNASELTIRSGNVVLDSNKQINDMTIDKSETMFASETSETKSVHDILQEEPCVPEEHQIDKGSRNRKSAFITILENTLMNRNTLFLTKSMNSLHSLTVSRTNSSRRSKGTSLHEAKRNPHNLKTHKTAYIMFLISLAFILSYLPLLAILLTRSINSSFVPGLSDTERAVYKFGLRSYYLSCTTNPLIYGIWDARFRKACRRIVRKLRVF